ncbi:ABC transporter substrate-binding protein [Arthrobacter sp. M4]|uniref:ABC transporter substrate-binding protein n=1 Tax=Arthrobacter sp. M4 TaxID=218160 RepID=UPI001CDC57CB|nr:ABC transporter substrate-binding protein [Arthrobacter sp. M4]MCA4133244.1 ABC transporter substrate-binding protein [Arthrobacter sp. M4]
MSHPIDVGSVLGGRYKVTATVLTSHDQDLVLDGVDQVLNRPVSILVAGPGNADQVAQSAREVATGERAGNVQILDLGVSDNTTYLITNHSSAPDLLDLVVASDEPYVEPFFTDTLGSEIFGQARSNEPEPYDGLYDDEIEAEYIKYGEHGVEASRPGPTGQQPVTQAPDQGVRRPPVVPPMPPRPAAAPHQGLAAKLAAAAAGAGAAATAAAAAVKGAGGKSSDAQTGTSGEGSDAVVGSGAGSGQAGTDQMARKPDSADTAAQDVQAQPTTQAFDAAGSGAGAGAGAGGAASGEKPKVSLWSDHDYGYSESSSDEHPGSGQISPGAAAFQSAPPSGTDYEEDEYYDDEPEREPRSLRWLVGGILAAVLVVGLILAITNLGSIFPSGQPSAGNNATTAPPATGSASGSPKSTGTTAPAAGPPSIESITRLGNFDFAATYDKDLAKAFDGNAASYWSDMEFATENWGGFATEVPLVVKLKAPSQVSSITLSQLGASGGSISVFTNDRPAMDGAKQVGTNSFTSQDLTMPLTEPSTAQYIIVSIKTLPKLAAPKTRYGYGLRLAEVKVQ